MKVRWLDPALADLDDMVHYISAERPAAAIRMVDRIDHAVAQLVHHPARGRPGRVSGTRELVVPNTPYIVPYRLRGEIIDILHVIHAARAWPERFED